MPPPQEPGDEELMARLQGGDDSALGELMRRWEPRLRLHLLRLLGRPAEADDAAQEAFVRLYQHRARFRSGAPFAPWIYTIAGNAARNRRRWWRRHPTTSLDEAEAHAGRGPLSQEIVDTSAPRASRGLEAEDTRRAVRQALDRLPFQLRHLVVLAELEERSHAEIASICGLSPKAVEMKLYRARAKLRRLLSDWWESEHPSLGPED